VRRTAARPVACASRLNTTPPLRPVATICVNIASRNHEFGIKKLVYAGGFYAIGEVLSRRAFQQESGEVCSLWDIPQR
jgi:hypothetical protein